MAIVHPSRLAEQYDGFDDAHDFECEVPTCGFTSRGWHTEEAATLRGGEHMNEHVTGELMTELTAFEEQVGFIRADRPTSQGVTLVVGDKEVRFDGAGNVIPDPEPDPEA